MATLKGEVEAVSRSRRAEELYADTSKDGILRLGNLVPDFEAESTQGPIRWYEYIEGSWSILFCHPEDFHPAGTTEVGLLAVNYEVLRERGVKIAVLSPEPLDTHERWLKDINTHCQAEVDFPIFVDAKREVAIKYGILDPVCRESQPPPMMAHSIFFIDTEKKLKLALHYPASVGYDINEIVRCHSALKISSLYSVATPANWPNNHGGIGRKGWAFLLPTITDEDAEKHFPDHFTCEVPSGRNYLRLTDVDATVNMGVKTLRLF